MLIVATLAIILVGTFADKCRVLALSGGAVYGAYEVGAISTIVNSDLDPESYNWDFISGVSAGSLNASLFTFFPPGQEKEAAAYIWQLWDDIEADWFYKTRPLFTIPFSPSVVDDQPLWDTCMRYFANYTISRPLIVGVTNWDTGSFDTFDLFNSDYTKEEACTIVVASSSMPVIFQPRQINGMTYVDGGALHIFDLPSIVNQCLDKGFKEEEVVIDVILCQSGRILPEFNPEKISVKEVWNRAKEIEERNASFYDIQQALKMYPFANWRYLISPSEARGGSNMDFSHKNLEKIRQLGVDDTLKILAEYGEKGNGRLFMDKIAQSNIPTY